MKKKYILLVEPKFPLSIKSKNYRSYLPIGLLKLASFYRKNGNKVKLVQGNRKKKNIGTRLNPDRILITSLFTYWSKYIRECVQHYRNLYPKARITVGGIYASLMPEHCKQYTGCDDVFTGLHKKAEKCQPAYDLIFNPHPAYQIIQASRGCSRQCSFCGTWKIEPQFTFKKSIKREICSNKLIFFDNNLLANPHIKEILKEIANTEYDGKAITCEAQCGFDGRLLTPELSKLIKKARFISIRIAWDWGYSQRKLVKKQIDMLVDAGYKSREMYVFMLYNWNIPFKEMEKKRIKCWEWKIQVADCRFRPLNQTFDNYNPRKKQTDKDYYIHPTWTDAEVKQFRKNVRRQNICVRLQKPFYSKLLEHRRIDKETSRKLLNMPKRKKERLLGDTWFPDRITCTKESEKGGTI